MTEHPPSRRRFLALLAGVGLGACAWDEPPPGADRPPPSTAPRPSGRSGRVAPSGAPTSTSEPFPAPVPWEPAASEVLPDAKRLAARVVEALTAYGPEEPPGAPLARALRPDLAAGGAPPAVAAEVLAAKAAPLLAPGARSVGEVVYPQLGGETPEACAVMVVVRQTLRGPDGRQVSATRTVDVRLRKTLVGWALVGVESAGGDPVAEPPDLSPVARAVLSDARIALPDSARWDVHAKRVDDRLLAAMAQLAAVAPFAVTALVSGHPLQVFGTERVSNHTVGRAVDVWRIGDAPVAAQRPGPATPAFDAVRHAHDASGAAEVGGPWDFDGPAAKRSFTNLVHQDHLHVGFGPAAPPT